MPISTTKNRNLLIALALLLFLAGMTPYLFALANQDAQHAFLGYLHFPEDMDSYFAFIHQAELGDWLFHNPYWQKENSAAYFNLLWLALGKVKALSSIGYPALFQLMRVVAAFSLVFGFGALLSAFKLPTLARFAAISLFAFTGGAGFLARSMTFSELPPDLYTGLYPFFQATFIPHAGIAHGLMLFALAFAIRGLQEENHARLFLSGGLFFMLGFIRIYDCFVGVLLVLLYMGWQAYQVPMQMRWRMLSMSLAALLPALLPMGYVYWLINYADGFSFWAQTNRYPAGDFFIFLLALGVIALAGMLGILFQWRGRRNEGQSIERFFRKEASFLLLWIATANLLLFTPLVDFAWRTTTAFMTPFFIGVAFLLARIEKKRYLAALFSALFFAGIVTSVTVVSMKIDETNAQWRYYYLSPKVIEAARWLAENEPTANVFSHGATSLKLAAFTPNPVVMGHKDLVADFDKRLADYRTFCRSRSSEVARGILEKYGAEILFFSPLDARCQKRKPNRWSGFEKRYDNGIVWIYQKR